MRADKLVGYRGREQLLASDGPGEQQVDGSESAGCQTGDWWGDWGMALIHSPGHWFTC